MTHWVQCNFVQTDPLWVDASCAVSDEVKTGTGGIDPGEGIRRLVKPTGILHRPRKEGRKDVQQRVDDSGLIAAEVAAKLAREFGDENAEILAQQQALDVAQLSAEQVGFEIGLLLRKKLRTEEEEVLLLLLLAASA